MMASDFLKRLRILNPKMKVMSYGSNGRLASIYYINREGPQDLIGVDKNWVPEYPAYDNQGHLTQGGWRRVCVVLLAQKLTTKELIRKAFGASFFDKRRTDHMEEIVRGIRVVNEVDDLIKERQTESWEKTGNTKLNSQDALDIASVLAKKKSDHDLEQREKEKWALNKSAEKYVEDHQKAAEIGQSWTEARSKDEFDQEFFKK
jgi:hypothetical protein